LEFTLGYPFYKTIRHPKLIFRAENPPNRQRKEIEKNGEGSVAIAKTKFL
jgi:hypothetical protein